MWQAPPAAAVEIAPAPAVDPTAERHDGLLLRLTIGIGYGTVSESIDGEQTLTGSEVERSISISGVSGSFSIDLGGVLTDNLAVSGRLSDLVIVDPTVSLDGNEVGEAQDSTLAALFFGPALTYYVMPVNVYLTAALGLSWLRSDTNETEAQSSDLGFGANLDVGKEWWVSDQWGLGVAGRLWWTHVSDSEQGIDIASNFLGFAVVFSATLN